jgi:hypothetical protein
MGMKRGMGSLSKLPSTQGVSVRRSERDEVGKNGISNASWRMRLVERFWQRLD